VIQQKYIYSKKMNLYIAHFYKGGLRLSIISTTEITNENNFEKVYLSRIIHYIFEGSGIT